MQNLRTLVKTIKILFAIGFLLLVFATDAEASRHTANQSCQEIYLPPPDTSFLDCTGVPWTEAFDEMHAKISQEYAFTGWRGINWQTIYSRFRPLIATAEAANDEAAYYQALRDYFLSIHDGHVTISPETDTGSIAFINDQLNLHVGGDYGLIIAPTDNGNYIVSYLTPHGSASEAGIKLGDEVVNWNNIAIAQAITNEPITWANEIVTDQSSGKSYGTIYNPSTQAGLRYEQTRLLTRDTIGHQVIITVFRPSTGVNITATLDARDDQMQTLNRTNLYAGVDLSKIVTYSILSSGFGYLKIVEELK